ncbi:MAG: hypothetical protein MUE33_02980 [Cytophagaceae bacterium]|jgi:TolA-binding protein|nr:hypothetical protein [Cytophagaceae bacterium]
MILNRKNGLKALALGSILLINACSLKQMVKMAKDQELTVTPSPLEVHGDSVAFDVSAILPLKMLKKNKIYSVNTFYKYGTEKLDLGAFDFVSTEYPDAKTTNPKMTKHYSYFYKPEIGNGDLVIIGTASNLEKTKSKSTDEFPIAKGIITTSRLVKDYYAIAYADHGYNNKEELVPTYVNFYFEQGSSKLRKTEMTGQNGKFLDAFILSKPVTRNVSIVGQHSPEGSETANTNLANERSQVIQKYIQERVKYYIPKGVKNKDSVVALSQYVTKGIYMDWAGFKAQLDSSSLSATQKSEILNIINGSGDFISKEKQLEKLPYFKKELLNGIYPKLRTARTELWSVKKKKTDAEISVLAKQICDGTVKLDTLSIEELGYAATLTSLPSEKVRIYEALVKKADNWVAYNNLGAALLELAKTEIDQNKKSDLISRATNYLEMSLKKQDSGEAHLNLASAYLMKGVRISARDEANKAIASKAGDNVKKGASGVLGVLDIKDGKYDMALSDLSKSTDSLEILYNTALTNLLKKDFGTAKSQLSNYNAKAPADAYGFYLSAVLAARQKDETALVSNLTKAVSLNAKAKERAAVDMEFYEYWNSENFKNVLK